MFNWQKLCYFAIEYEETVAHSIFSHTLHVVHTHGERCNISTLFMLWQDHNDSWQRNPRQGQHPIFEGLHDHCHGVSVANDTNATCGVRLPCLSAVGCHNQRLAIAKPCFHTTRINHQRFAAESRKSASATIPATNTCLDHLNPKLPLHLYGGGGTACPLVPTMPYKHIRHGK